MKNNLIKKSMAFIVTFFVLQGVFSAFHFLAYAESLYDKSNIKNIFVDDITYFEYEHGSFVSVLDGKGEYNEYFHYDVMPETIIVEYKDDETKTLFKEELYILFGDEFWINDIQTLENQWKVGSHKVSATYKGLPFEYTINILKNPLEISQISAKYLGKLIENVDSINQRVVDENNNLIDTWPMYWMQDSLIEITIIHNDGHKSVTTLEDLQQESNIYINLKNNQSYENQWHIGKNKVELQIGPIHTEFEFEIIENPYKSITISGDEKLLITLEKKNGEIVKSEAKSFRPFDRWENHIVGLISTTKGDFCCEFVMVNNNYENVKLSLGSLESNSLTHNSWIPASVMANDFLELSLAWNMCENSAIDYKGTIDSSNIDAIAWLSVNANYESLDHTKIEVTEKGLVFDANYILQIIEKHFHVNEQDLEKSNNYNNQTNKFTVIDFGYGWDRINPICLKKDEDVWKAEMKIPDWLVKNEKETEDCFILIFDKNYIVQRIYRYSPLGDGVKNVNVDDYSLDYKSQINIIPQIEMMGEVEYTVTYKTSNPNVAVVDNEGNLVATGRGSAEISVSVVDEFGNEIGDTFKVVVDFNWWQWIVYIILLGFIWY